MADGASSVPWAIAGGSGRLTAGAMSKPTLLSPGHRGCAIFRGPRTDTAARAHRVVERLSPGSVLWISARDDGGRLRAVVPRRLAAQLGGSFDAVVVDAHDGLDPQVVGQAHGLVRGGGALLLRLWPDTMPTPVAGRVRLAAYPYAVGHVGDRLDRRLLAALRRVPAVSLPLPPAAHVPAATSEQRQLVADLVATWSRPGPSTTVVTADRGRGKSSAIGLALAQLQASALRGVSLTGPAPAAVAEAQRFFGEAAPAFLPALDASRGDDTRTIVVVDEAAQLPVPVLRRLVARHPRAHLVFVTTVHGYEGTGRGFALRFVPWLHTQRADVVERTLTSPIRWADGDPLERAVFDAFVLDARPATAVTVQAPRPVALDRETLASDETRLREVFGLLVQAHYRTTPTDLRRMLDAPNLDVHAMVDDGRVVGVTLVAREGGLPPELCARAATGQTRLRAHALPDALLAHLGRVGAGSLRYVRSVRIAVSPRLRRHGIASALVDHVHASYDADLFGTIFGADAGLLAFRRAVGYELARVSASRGARTGEPSVMMLRPASAAGRTLLADLREELARILDVQLRLLAADEELLLAPALDAALRQGLPRVPGWSDAQCRRRAQDYAFGPRTFESCPVAVRRVVQAHLAAVAALPPSAQAVLRSRVLEGRGWIATAATAGLTVPAAMRQLRRAVRALLERATDAR